MRRYGWTDDELAVLRAALAAGTPHRLVAEQLGRTRQGVSYMAAQLGYGKPRGEPSDDELRARLLARRRIAETGCWLYTGQTRADGYGSIGVGYRVLAVHRLAYRLFAGADPGSAVIQHECDTPACFNPAHLRAGTVATNNADMCAKGRHARGERHGGARYTADQISQVKRLLGTVPRRVVAEQTGVGLATVNRVADGSQWKEVARRDA